MSLRTHRRTRHRCVTGKIWFSTEAAALAALAMGTMLGDRAYDCDKCTGWHVTSQPYEPGKQAS